MLPSRPTAVLRFLLGVLAALPAAALAAAADNWLGVAHQLAAGGAAVDFTPHGTQPGLFYDLDPTNDCAGCHGASGSIGKDFRPFPTWSGSMMANATRDPVFFAALDVANKDVPGVGDYCLRCHSSRGWYRGHVVKTGGTANDVTLGAAGCLLTGSYDWEDTLDNDYSGLPCHYCHRLTDSGPGGAAAMIGNANAWVDDEACSEGDGSVCRRGPYDYAVGSPPPHAWKYSEYHTESRLCGLCHDVTTPDTDQGPLKTLKLADGTDSGRPFPIERTYSEWLQSDYAVPSSPVAATCQSCHMKDSEDPDATACNVPGYPNRSGNLPVHAFTGGNTWVPGILKGEYSDTSSIPGAFGGVGRQDAFDQTVAWARETLAQAAAVETTIAGYTPPGSGAGSLQVRVKVTNLSGHKLPTGYAEGRRMWLNLLVKDATGRLVFESAAYDPASGVLTVDAQARVYEALQGIWNHNGSGACDVVDGSGQPMFHFALNDCVAKDNRIPPLGFRPATAADPNGYDTRPVGATYAQTAPGSGILVNYDTVDYAVPVPAGTPGPLTATARLYYQTSSKEYIEFLRDEAVRNGTQGENAMCSGGPNRPFVVGPQERTRGQYLYELWSRPSATERIFADGFDGTAPPAGYGKSPPELMQVASATTGS
jgi:hypothetical protein